MEFETTGNLRPQWDIVVASSMPLEKKLRGDQLITKRVGWHTDDTSKAVISHVTLTVRLLETDSVWQRWTLPSTQMLFDNVIAGFKGTLTADWSPLLGGKMWNPTPALLSQTHQSGWLISNARICGNQSRCPTRNGQPPSCKMRLGNTKHDTDHNCCAFGPLWKGQCQHQCQDQTTKMAANQLQAMHECIGFAHGADDNIVDVEGIDLVRELGHLNDEDCVNLCETVHCPLVDVFPTQRS
jgi:hypothetical protein